MRLLFMGLDSPVHSALKLLAEQSSAVVEVANDPGDAEHFLMFGEFDAAVFSADMHGGIAVRLARSLRRERCKTPILLLTREGHPDAVAQWLEHVDDVVRLPVDCREVLARVNAIVRRNWGQLSSDVRIENVVLNTGEQSVRVNGRVVHLTHKEFQVLALLVARRNTVVTKEVILSHLYAERDEPELKIIDVFICKLRHKLRGAGAPHDFVSTTWGRGYSVRHVDPAVRASELAAECRV